MRIGSWAVAGWIVVAACGPSDPGPLAEAALLRLQCDQLMLGLEHYVTAEGVRRARVVADTACFLEDRATVQLTRVRVTFYDPLGAPSSNLTSDSAAYDWMSGDMRALGNVVVVDAESGRRVETSVLHYERPQERIWSDQPTTMTEPDGTVVEGTGFRSSSALDQVEMDNARLTRPPGRGAPPAPAGAAGP